MNDGFNDALESGMKGAAEGFAKGISEKVPPVYTDLIQPGARALGKGIGDTIKIALSPISGTIWGIEKISEWLQFRLSQKLKDIPLEDIIEPKGSIVGPSIEAIKFLSSENELREMFAQLIATSLNKKQADVAHPGFVEIIKNLSTTDALVLKYITDRHLLPTIDFWIQDEESNSSLSFTVSIFLHHLNIESRFDGTEILKNLERLGLIERKLGEVADIEVFNEILSSKDYDIQKSQHTVLQAQGIFKFYEQKIIYTLTSFGRIFTLAVFENTIIDD